MMHTYTLDELREIDCLSTSLTYNTAGADTLTLSGLTPEWAARLNWQRWDNIIITDAGTPIFAGTVTAGIERAAQGGAAPRASFTAASDWAILDQTTYTAISSDGTPDLASRAATPAKYHKAKKWTGKTSTNPTASTSKILTECFNAAADWDGSRILSTLACTLAGQTVPMNQSGAATCAQLMQSALEWTPDAVIRMGYPDCDPETASGLVMHIDESASLPAITIDADTHDITAEGATETLGTCDGITDISLSPRPDLVLPAVALIGAQHWSLGGDAREPGAFVYCVTRTPPEETEDEEDDDDSAGTEEEEEEPDTIPAYTAPDEKKTIISGIPVPPRCTLDGEGFTSLAVSDAATHKVLAHCYPFLDKLGQGRYLSGRPVLYPAKKENVRPAATPGRLTDKDDGTPANYDTAFISGFSGAYVHVDGNFPASHRSSRNISGLKWCKGTLRCRVAMRDGFASGIDRATQESFFSGRYKKANGSTIRYADLTINCNFINSRKRIVKGIIPLDTDEGTTTEEPDTPGTPEEPAAPKTEAEPAYIELLTDYYNASQTLCHEGAITLTKAAVHPSVLLGRAIRITGLAAEWAGMNAVCRSISYDLGTSRMTLQLGTRGVLGFDLRLERARMSLRRMQNEREADLVTDPLPSEDSTTENPDTPGTGDDDDTTTTTTTEEDTLMVSPSINASVSAGEKSGIAHRPFDFYDDDGAWTMQGGSVFVGNQELTIPTTSTQVTAGKPGGALAKGTKYRLRVYRGTDPNTGQPAWTYDLLPKSSS